MTREQIYNGHQSLSRKKNESVAASLHDTRLNQMREIETRGSAAAVVLLFALKALSLNLVRARVRLEHHIALRAQASRQLHQQIEFFNLTSLRAMENGTSRA